MKIYLDTNIMLDFFLNKAKSINGAWRFRYPKKMEFLIGNVGPLQFVTSFLTKAEVYRELLCQYGMKTSEVEDIWRQLSEMLRWEYIDEFCFDESLCGFIGNFEMRLRTLMNFQHLFIAYRKDLYFVTGDKNPIKIIRERKLYDKAMTYIELRAVASSF